MGVVPVPGAPAPPAPATGTRRASLAFGSVQGAPVPRQFGDFTGKDGDFIRKKSGDLTQKTGMDFKQSYFFTSIFGMMVSQGMIPRQEIQPFSG